MTLWYVDNSVGSSGAGTSWAAAWKDFNNIVWGGAGVLAGDTIYISGGSVSQTYNAQKFTVGASGGAGNPITVTAGIDAGHTGTVIIDGTTTSVPGDNGLLDNNSFTNLVFQNLTIQNCVERCVFIHGISSGTLVYQNLTIHTGVGLVQTVATSATTAAGSAILHFTSGTIPNFASYASVQNGVEDLTTQAAIPTASGNNYVIASTATSLTLNENVASPGVGLGDSIGIAAANVRGFDCRSNTGGTISVLNNFVDTPALSPGQTDTWYSQDNTGASILVSRNKFIVNNADAAWHSDTIQSSGNDTNITFSRNFLYHPNGGFNNHGIIVGSVVNGGTLWFYNNIIVMSGGAQAEASIFRQNPSATTGACKFWNNTIYGQWNGITYANTVAGTDEFKNNIIYLVSGGPSGAAPYILPGSITTSIINFNTVFLQTGTVIAVISGTNNTWAQWQTAGYDASSINADPQFVAAGSVADGFRLKYTSPCIDAGMTL
jgi:hypothetical protein